MLVLEKQWARYDDSLPVWLSLFSVGLPENKLVSCLFLFILISVSCLFLVSCLFSSLSQKCQHFKVFSSLWYLPIIQNDYLGIHLSMMLLGAMKRARRFGVKTLFSYLVRLVPWANDFGGSLSFLIYMKYGNSNNHPQVLFYWGKVRSTLTVSGY